MNNNINVCISCDDNYSKHAGVVIASILANANKDDELSIFILDGGITEQHKAEILSLKAIKNCDIDFVTVDENLFESYSKIKTHSYVTVATYYRLKLSSLLPNIDRIIYFDCDIIVNSSLSELFNVDMNDSLIAGALDLNKKELKKNPNYVNAGMLVFNLKNMRLDDTENKFLQWTQENADSIKVGDQTIINEVCKGRIKIVPDEWNVQSSNFTNRSSYTNNPNVIHFVARKKPWHWASFSYHKELYFKYLQLTPWKMDANDYKHWTKDNQRASVVEYLRYRPLFFLRPRFYEAFIKTYVTEKNSLFRNLFYFGDYNNTHNILKFCGLRLKFKKNDVRKKVKELTDFDYYKKNNIDITSLPPAQGQLRDIQLANLVLLKELDYVCAQSNLQYWLAFGSLLGAVRHKGFIPWDDDVDTGMIREDYNRVIEAFEKFSRNPDIYADYYRCPNNPSQVIIKVLHKKMPHLFVDIFPYDYCGTFTTKAEQLKQTKQMKISRSKFMKNITHSDNNIQVLEVIDKCRKDLLSGHVLAQNPDLVLGVDFNHHWVNWFASYDAVFPLKKMKFEDGFFSCVNNPNLVLSNIYEDYMAYPRKIGVGHSMLLNLTDDEKVVIEEIIGTNDKI